MTLEDTVLYEELGGIWKLSELEELGKSKKDANLMQLSFWVTYDEARKEYIDTGCWADLDTGEVYMNYNYRPLKSLKYVKQEDSVFGVAKVPKALSFIRGTAMSVCGGTAPRFGSMKKEIMRQCLNMRCLLLSRRQRQSRISSKMQ